MFSHARDHWESALRAATCGGAEDVGDARAQIDQLDEERRCHDGDGHDEREHSFSPHLGSLVPAANMWLALGC